jgi:DNA-binding NtrC family response regulator
MKRLAAPLHYLSHPARERGVFIVLLADKGPEVELIGRSSVARQTEQHIACAARSDAKVLITGESGVGKEVVARLIHNGSHRARGPLITINCAGVPDSLLESELFGHLRGSFTDAHRDRRGWLEQAQGGTIFMDEVGEMSLRMQALLLRFLENGEIQQVGSERVQRIADVRVIAATNRDLRKIIEEKTFREDLFYRLNVIHIAIPPLRERREDVPLLFAHFLRVYSTRHRTEPPHVTEAAMTRLTKHHWPGNVRELKNVVERLVVRTVSGIITPEDLPREISGSWIGTTPAVDERPASRPAFQELFERMSIGGESFWSVVSEPFMSRDLTRLDVRQIVTRGLEETRGNYRMLAQFFNLAPRDYKRFLSFLRSHDCQVPMQRFRTVPPRIGNAGVESAPPLRFAS